MNLHECIGVARALMRTARLEPAEAVAHLGSLIPEEMRAGVLHELEAERAAERSLPIQRMTMLENADRVHRPWLPPRKDRPDWYFWPRLRHHLLTEKGWTETNVDSLDTVTDRILGALEDPRGDRDFDTRGLVVGFIQSGKTANYSALMAKAADAGYRMFIVLSGIHDSLRQQTQRRLNGELVGGTAAGVPPPTSEAHTWMLFTTPDLQGGDFRAGNTNASVIGTNRPSLIVARKKRSTSVSGERVPSARTSPSALPTMGPGMSDSCRETRPRAPERGAPAWV